MHLKDLALRHARDGRLSRHYEPADLAEELEFPRRPRTLFNALVRHGVLDEQGDLTPACWGETENGRYVALVEAERQRSARRRQAKREAEAAAEETAQAAQPPPTPRAPTAPQYAPPAPSHARTAPVDAPAAPVDAPSEAPAAPPAAEAAPALALAPEAEGAPEPTDAELLEQLIAKDPKPRNRRRIEAIWRKMERPQMVWALRARRHLNGTKYAQLRQNGDERYIPYLDGWLAKGQWTEVPLEKLKPRKPPRRAEAPAPSPEAEAENRSMFARRAELRDHFKAEGKTGADLDAAIESAMDAEFKQAAG